MPVVLSEIEAVELFNTEQSETTLKATEMRKVFAIIPVLTNWKQEVKSEHIVWLKGITTISELVILLNLYSF